MPAMPFRKIALVRELRLPLEKIAPQRTSLIADSLPVALVRELWLLLQEVAPVSSVKFCPPAMFRELRLRYILL